MEEETGAPPEQKNDSLAEMRSEVESAAAVYERNIKTILADADPSLVSFTTRAKLAAIRRGELQKADEGEVKSAENFLITVKGYLEEFAAQRRQYSIMLKDDADAVRDKLIAVRSAGGDLDKILRVVSAGTLQELVGKKIIIKGDVIAQKAQEQLKKRKDFKEKQNGDLFDAQLQHDGSYVVERGGQKVLLRKAAGSNDRYLLEGYGTILNKSGKKEFTGPKALEDGLKEAWKQVGTRLTQEDKFTPDPPQEASRLEQLEAENSSLKKRIEELEAAAKGGSETHTERSEVAGAHETKPDVINAVHTDAPAVHGPDAGHRGGHEAHGATEFDARALRKQHAHEAILRSFAQQSRLGVNPETMNALRQSELSANIESLRNRGLFKRIGSFIVRAAMPALVAGTAAYFMAPALAAWAFGGVLGSGVSLFGATLTSAQVATGVAGAMIGAPTGFVGRALDQWRSNRKYGVGTGFIHAFWPFSTYGGELGKTLLTGDMVRNKAASSSRIERAQAPLFKHYNELEKQRNTLYNKHSLLMRKLGVAPAALTAQLAQANQQVGEMQAHLSSYDNIAHLRHGKFGTFADAQRSGENFVKWRRIIGTAFVGATAGFGGGMVHSGLLDGVMTHSPSGAGRTLALADTTPAVGPRADVVPPPGTRVGGSAAAEVTGDATRASMESELARAKAEIARLRAAGVPADKWTAANRRILELENLLDARSGKAPTGAEMAERIKARISGAEVGGGRAGMLSQAEYWHQRGGWIRDTMHLSHTDCGEGTVDSIQRVLGEYKMGHLSNDHRIVALLDYYLDPQGPRFRNVPSPRQLLTDMGANPADATRIRSGLKMEYLFGNKQVQADLISRLERQMSPREFMALVGPEGAKTPLRHLFHDAALLIARNK